MNILLLNPPHTAIGSRIPHEHLPPLGVDNACTHDFARYVRISCSALHAFLYP